MSNELPENKQHYLREHKYVRELKFLDKRYHADFLCTLYTLIICLIVVVSLVTTQQLWLLSFLVVDLYILKYNYKIAMRIHRRREYVRTKLELHRSVYSGN